MKYSCITAGKRARSIPVAEKHRCVEPGVYPVVKRYKLALVRFRNGYVKVQEGPAVYKLPCKYLFHIGLAEDVPVLKLFPTQPRIGEYAC